MSHGDYKPENIVVDSQYNVRLVDFGLAQGYGPWIGPNDEFKVISSARASLRWLTAILQALGETRGRVAPEVALRMKMTRKSDIFGMGMTVYYLYVPSRTGTC